MTPRRSRFPNPREASPEGIVAVGGDLSAETLIDAYSHGIFPWPQEGLPLLWFSPEERGVIELSEVVAPERFLRTVASWQRRGRLVVKIDSAFSPVLRACRVASRKGQDGTWILPEMETAYAQLHKLGIAHSFETYLDGELVGGLYGVFLRGVFSGESMFHTKTDAGKVALWAALEFFRRQGAEFIDVQMVTPVVSAFGGKLIPREEYLCKLELAQKRWDRGLCRFEWVKGPLSL